MKSLYDAMLDPALFGRTFAGDSFGAWRTVAKILDGLPLTKWELKLYRDITGRTELPTEPFDEGYLIKPRRSGGTLFGAACGLHAALTDYRPLLGPGEVATVALVASDRRQARQMKNYVDGLIEDSPIIRAEVMKQNTEAVEFAHRSVIEVHTGSFRSTRGYSFAAFLLDEIAFLRDDSSALPDVELVRAVRPGLTNLRGRLLAFSSPHARRGHLWSMYRKHYGQDSDVLVIKAGGLTLNPTLDQKVIDKARAEDPVAARSEWDAEFRPDLAAFLDDALVDAAVVPGRCELPPAGHSYVAFADPSGGRHDSFTLSIAHRVAERVVQDVLLVTMPPFVPDAIVRGYCDVLKRFGLSSISGDRYGAEWVSASFAKHGISYVPATKDKSAIYIESLPQFTARTVDLLDVPKLATELRLLERRSRTRGDTVDHPPRGSDDAANATCGAIWLAVGETAADSQVFPADWVRKAQGRWRPESPYYPPVSAMGISRSGPQTFVALRRVGWYGEIQTGGVTFAPEVAGFVVSKRRDNATVVVDIEHGNGSEVAGHLKTNGIAVKGFRGKVDSVRHTEDRQLPFVNKFSEACWRFREVLNPERNGGTSIQLPNDPELVADLTAFTYEVTSKGIEVTQARPAPRAEAVVLAWTHGPKTLSGDSRPKMPAMNMGPRRR